jgi:hypothetical protein
MPGTTLTRVRVSIVLLVDCLFEDQVRHALLRRSGKFVRLSSREVGKYQCKTLSINGAEGIWEFPIIWEEDAKAEWQDERSLLSEAAQEVGGVRFQKWLKANPAMVVPLGIRNHPVISSPRYLIERREVFFAVLANEACLDAAGDDFSLDGLDSLAERQLNDITTIEKLRRSNDPARVKEILQKSAKRPFMRTMDVRMLRLAFQECQTKRPPPLAHPLGYRSEE